MFSHNEDAGHYENLSDLEPEPCEEMASEFAEGLAERRRGKRPMTKLDPEDDPDEADEDYLGESGSESEAPSEAFEDIEASSDDDVFDEARDRSKNARRKKLGDMKKNARRKKRDNCWDEPEPDSDAPEWYSDADNDEDFDDPPGSDDEMPKFPIWKEGSDIKKLKWVVGYRFLNVKVYKEVLIDWSIRQGFEKSRLFSTTWSGGVEFEVEVKENESYVVRLDNKTCTCGIFQLSGYPCIHACAALRNRRYNVEDYVDDCYKKEKYLLAYSGRIHAVPGRMEFLKSNLEQLRVPNFKRKMGRPKKKRRKSAAELENASTRKGLTHTCSKCLQPGHNIKGCKNQPHPNSKHATQYFYIQKPSAPRGRKQSGSSSGTAANNGRVQQTRVAPNPLRSTHGRTSSTIPVAQGQGLGARNEAARPSNPRARKSSSAIPKEKPKGISEVLARLKQRTLEKRNPNPGPANL